MGKFIDLTGKKFGHWYVESYAGDKKWNCICDCENHTRAVVQGYTLRNGTSISCGCYAKEQRRKAEMLREESDLVGVKRGNFTALKYLGDNVWLCKCKCGNEIELTRRQFLDKYKKSCGCINFLKDLTGKRFGLWNVIKYVGKSKWLCRCDCGTEAEVSTNQLIHGKSTKCRWHRNKNNIKFPQWFIDELVDKSLVGKINTHDYVDFICREHGVYTQQVGQHIRLSDNTRLSGCPSCSKSLNIVGSKNENEIFDFIIKNFPQYVIERHTRDILDGKEIDIYLPELKIGIEYNGSAFHATENGVYGNIDKYYHRNKFLLARSKGIHLISVFDIDYDKNKSDVLKYIYDVISQNVQHDSIIGNTVITNNDFDDGSWVKKLGFIEHRQLIPEFYTFKNRVVYRSGKTEWILTHI